MRSRSLVLALVLGVLHCGAAEARRIELYARSPQGILFKLSEPIAVPNALQQADALYDAMGGNAALNPRTRQLALRRVKESEGLYRWHFAWYDTGDQPFSWPKDQLPILTMADSTRLPAAEVIAMTPSDAHQPIRLGLTDQRLWPAQLNRPANRPSAVLLYVAFPIDAKVRDANSGRLRLWSQNDIVSVSLGSSGRPAQLAGASR